MADPQAQTFLFADLAGYTALTEAHGDEHAAEVVGDFCRSVRALSESHGANEVKSIGDAVLLHTTDPATAVHVGMHIVEEIGSRHGFPTVRVGVHTGPAVERDGDWFGSAVNVAARVVSMASEREVLVTAATREAAVDRVGDLEFVSAGVRRLKNVTTPIEVFRPVSASAETAVGMPVDPVCRMAVDPGRAAGQFSYGGRDHYFCSERCREAFVKNPSLYADAPRGARRHLLVSDNARERAAERLGRAYRRGRLTTEELEHRVQQAYGARTRAELQAVTRDLPGRRSRHVRWWRLLLPWTWFRRRRRGRT
jgi:class 3 adenylate cyclase/YHS domain-containing protein